MNIFRGAAGDLFVKARTLEWGKVGVKVVSWEEIKEVATAETDR